MPISLTVGLKHIEAELVECKDELDLSPSLTVGLKPKVILPALSGQATSPSLTVGLKPRPAREWIVASYCLHPSQWA